LDFRKKGGSGPESKILRERESGVVEIARGLWEYLRLTLQPFVKKSKRKGRRDKTDPIRKLNEKSDRNYTGKKKERKRRWLARKFVPEHLA